MNLGELFFETNFALGKDQYGNYVTPANFPQIINDFIQPEMMNAWVRKFESSREMGNDIRPFIKTLGDTSNPYLTLVPWSAASNLSYGQFPTDFWYFSDSYATEFINSCGSAAQAYNMVEWTTRERFNYLITNSLLFPTTDEPIASIQGEKIVVCPALTKIAFTYLRTPLDVYFDYDIVSGTIVYLPPGTTHQNSSVQPSGSPSLSIELEWPESTHPEFLRKLVQYYGRNIQSQVDMTMPDTKPD